MDSFFVGQPAPTIMKVKNQEIPPGEIRQDGSAVFRVAMSDDAILRDSLELDLLFGEDHTDVEPHTIRIAAISRHDQRRARKRGWHRLRISSGSTTRDLVGYLLYASGFTLPLAFCLMVKDRSGSVVTLVFFYKPDKSSFLGKIHDETSIADLSLPGTHDTCAFYGVPVSQCQQLSTPLSQQLIDGVRFIDIRCRVVKGELIVYHGIRNQRTTFVAVLADLRSFLESHSTETVIMSIKDEQRHQDFSRLVWLDMQKYGNVWFLENRVPTLGEVRGRAIIVGRFWISPEDDNWENGVGWRMPGWGPPVQDLQFDCGGIKGILQDWYTLSSFLQIPEKLVMTVEVLRTRTESENTPRLSISYASASGYPLAPPFLIAKGFGWPEWGFGIEGINSRLEGWLVGQLRDGKKVKGIVPLDFYRQTGSSDDSGVCELLVLMNML